jgi:hypothetical protein
LVKNREQNNVLFLLLFSAGLFLTYASVSSSHLQTAQTVYGTIDSGYSAAAVGYTGIGGTSGTLSTLDDLPPISATFNEPMDGTTLNSSTFTVRDSNGDNISGTVSLGSDNKTATFTPLSPLVYSSEYIATINTGAEDLAGNPLPTDNSWSFFTTNIDDNQSEDISDVSHYDTVDTNITSSDDVSNNGTSRAEVAPIYTHPAPNQQGQQQTDDNVSSTTSSPFPLPAYVGTPVTEKSLQPSTSETTSGFAGNRNQSSSTLAPLNNTKDNSIATPEGKGTEEGSTISQPSDLGTIPSLQQPQQYQRNLLPYQQYYQYPPQQLNQNEQFSSPLSNLTNNYITDGMGITASPLASETTTILQQPPLQQQPPPTSFTEPLSYPDISPPETYLISAVDNNGVNVPSGTVVSSDLITITFEGIDDSASIVEYQCSYDGQTPYSCASPFTIDNSMALLTTGASVVPTSNSHTLLISAKDGAGNIDQTPASFDWTVGPVQETTEVIPSTEPLIPIPSSVVAPTEPTAISPEVTQPLPPPLPSLIGNPPPSFANRQ